MHTAPVNSNNDLTDNKIKQASNNAMASFLNLTFLPGLAFIYLLFSCRKSDPDSLGYYHALLGIKLNIIAGLSLFLVSGLMVLLGGIDSPWTWVYVITYFTFVHTAFILFAVWAVVRAWSGQKIRAD